LLDTGNELGLKDTRLTRDVAIRIISALHTDNRIAIMQFATADLCKVDHDRAAIDKVLKTKLNSGKSSRLANAIAAAPISSKTRRRHASYRLITDGVNAPGGQVTMTSALKQLNSMQVSVHIVSYTCWRGRLCNSNQSDSWRRRRAARCQPASNPVLTAILRCRPNHRTPGSK